jgi:negative regulator of sigma E activity
VSAVQVIKDLWPIAAFVVVQTIAGVWWASSTTQRQDATERQLAALTVKLEAGETARVSVADRVIRLEEQIRQVYESARRIEMRLDQIVPQRRTEVEP